MSEAELLRALALVPAGMALAGLHFLGLRANTRLFLAPDRHRRAFALQALRVVATAAAFLAVAQAGAAALLGAAVGFLLARPFLIRRMARGQWIR